MEREQKKAEREAAAKKAELAAKQREARSKKRQKPASNVATKTAENSSAPSNSNSVDGLSKSTNCTSSRLTTLHLRESSVPNAKAKIDERSPDAENININQCCVCFGTFQEDQELGTDFEWVECACKRWLHEICVSDIEINSDGKELLCPFCCV